MPRFWYLAIAFSSFDNQTFEQFGGKVLSRHRLDLVEKTLVEAYAFAFAA